MGHHPFFVFFGVTYEVIFFTRPSTKQYSLAVRLLSFAEKGG
jgi:hypothetical protein